MNMMERLLRLMAERKASDIYLSAHSPVLIRINGICLPVNAQVLPPTAPLALLSEVVPAARIGTAYGMMTLLQNAGLTVSNYAVGVLNDRGGASADNPEGYAAMLWYFGVLASVSLVFALLLRARERGPHGHGLELPEARGAH